MADKVYTYKGKFDPNDIIKGLRQLQSQMNGLNLGEAMSKGYDKKINDLVSKAEQLSGKIKAGFTSSGEIKTFQKDAEKLIASVFSLGESFKSTNLEFSKLNLPPEISDQFKEIDKSIQQAQEDTKNFQTELKNLVSNLTLNNGVKGQELFSKKDLDTFAEAINDSQELNRLIQDRINMQNDNVAGLEREKTTLDEQLTQQQNKVNKLEEEKNKIEEIQQLLRNTASQSASNAGIKLTKEDLNYIEKNATDPDQIAQRGVEKQQGYEVKAKAQDDRANQARAEKQVQNELLESLKAQSKELDKQIEALEKKEKLTPEETQEKKDAVLEKSKINKQITATEGEIVSLSKIIGDATQKAGQLRQTGQDTKELFAGIAADSKKSLEKNGITEGTGSKEKTKEYTQEVAQLTKIKNHHDSISEKLTEEQNKLSNMKEFQDQMVTASETLKSAGTTPIETEGIAKTAQDANKAAESVDHLTKEKKELEDTHVSNTEAEMKNLGNAAEEMGNNMRKSSEDIQQNSIALQNFEKASQSLDNFKNRIGYLLGATSIFYKLRQGIQKAWTAIKDLDKAFTEIAVVTDKTTDELWESFETYNNMAQKLGVTTTDAIKTSALFYQQGLETAEVMTLTEETIKMARIAGMDFAEATDRMTAALRGFKLEMDDASRVNDIFSALAAKSAVDTDELSYALTKTASIAKSAGMEIETTSAFLSQMIETTREAPENIGTAMKTIIARFQELKTNVSEVEIEGEIVDVNKVDTALKSVGVSLRDNLTGQFRDLDDVFLELSSKWDGLDRNTQRYIATIAAGSRQQSRFLAMMDNYERTTELVNIAQNSSGASATQFGKTLNSLESKINKVSASFEELIGTLSGSDFFKGLLDMVNSILQAVNNIADVGFLPLVAIVTNFILTIKRGLTSFTTLGQDMVKKYQQYFSQMGTEASQEMQEAGQMGAEYMVSAVKGSNIKKELKEQIIQGIEEGAAQLAPELQKEIQGSNIQPDVKGKILGTPSAQQAPVTKTSLGQRVKTTLFGSKEEKQALKLEKDKIKQQKQQLKDQDKINKTSNQQQYQQTQDQAKENKKIKQNNMDLRNTVSNIANSVSMAGSMVVTGIAANKGSAATTGAMIGQTIGQTIGTIGYAFGPIAGAITSMIGTIGGSIIGMFAGEANDNATYGIGSESSIKKRQETADAAQKQYNKIAEENKVLQEQGKIYLNLDKKITKTTEDVENMQKAQDTLIAQYPALTAASGRFTDALKNQVKAANEATADAALSAAAATANVNYATAYREYLGVVEDEEARTYFDSMKDNISGISLSDFNKQTGLDASAEDFESYLAAFQTFRDAVDKEVDSVSDSLSATYGTIFDNFDADSYANKNKQLLLSYLEKSIPDTDYEKMMAGNLSGDDTEKILNQYFPEETFDAIANKLNSLTKEEQEKFSRALGQLGSMDIEYIKEELNDNDLEIIIGQMYSTMQKDFDANWKNLSEEQKTAINNYAKEYGATVAEAFAGLSSIVSDKSAKTQQAFIDAYAKMLGNWDKTQIDNISKGLKSSLTEVVTAISSTDFTSSWSISKLVTQMEKLGTDTQDTASLINILGAASNRTGLKGSDALQLINAQLEKMQGFVESVGKAIDGSMSIEQFSNIQNSLRELELEPIPIDKIFVTNDGVGVTGGIEQYIKQITGETGNIFVHQAAQAQAAEEAARRELKIVQQSAEYQKGNTEAIQRAKELQSSAADYALGKELYLIESKQYELQIQNQIAQSEKERIKAAKDLLLSLERYYNLERNILEVENRLSQFELDFEVADTVTDKGNALQGQFMALVDQRALLEKEGELYQKDLTDLTKTINKKYNEFFTVDSEGVLQLNYKGWKGLADQIENATDAERENLELQQDELEKVKEAYEDVYDRVNDNTTAQKENTKAIKEYYKTLRSNVITVQEQIADAYIKNLEDELDAVKKKYDKIKEEDQKYLESLRKNLDKRKQAQEDADSEEDIATLRNKIALLSRDTSGIYAKEIQELEKELAEKERDQQNTALERMYENEQEQVNARADGLAAREEYLTEQLEKEKKYHTETNQFIEQLYKQGSDAIVKYLLSNNDNYVNGTKEQQDQIREETTETVDNAIASQDSLGLKIDDFADNAKKKYEDTVISTVEEYLTLIDQANGKILDVKVDISSALSQINALEARYNEMQANVIRRELEDLLIQIKNKAQSGQDANNLISQYKDKLSLLKTYDSKARVGEGGSNFANTEPTQNDKYPEASYTTDLVDSIYESFKNTGGGEPIVKNEKLQLKDSTPENSISSAYYEYSVKTDKIPTDDNTFDHAKIGIYKDPTENNGTAGRFTTEIEPYSQSTVGAGDIATYSINYTYEKLYVVDRKVGQDGKTYYRVSNREDEISLPGFGAGGWVLKSSLEKWYNLTDQKYGSYISRFATGGMVDYTGPAWVDGTPNKPEAFLSAADTENIAQLRDILSKVFASKYNDTDSSITENNGDTYYEFHINVEELGEGYDVEKMMKEMEKYILQKANYRKVVNAKRR